MAAGSPRGSWGESCPATSEKRMDVAAILRVLVLLLPVFVSLLAVFVPLAGIAWAWWLNKRSEREWESYLRREQSYRELARLGNYRRPQQPGR